MEWSCVCSATNAALYESEGIVSDEECFVQGGSLVELTSNTLRVTAGGLSTQF